MSQGWIKLHRKIQESALYKNLNSKQRDVMLQLLMMANHKVNEWEWNGEIFKAHPGEFVTSIQSIKEHCASDVSVQSVRTALLKLEKWGFLTNKSTKDGRLISIINYSTYQSNGEETNNQSNEELTKHQQSSNKELTTNKNVKNDKKYINDRWKEISDDISKLWIKTFGKLPNLIEYEETQKLINEFGKEKVEKEFREAIINGAKSLRYVINALTNSNGVKTNAADNTRPKSLFQQRLEYKPNPEKYKSNLEYYKKRFG